MDEDSQGYERMEIVDESNEEEEEEEEEQAFRVVAIRANAFRQLFGLLRHNPNSSRQSSQENSQLPDGNNDSAREPPVNFDTELPTEHSYLGNMTQVSGVGYLDADKLYKMLIFVHHSVVFPGETLPMIISEYLFEPALYGDEVLLFGVIFPRMWPITKPKLYGITCQIYEKRNDSQGHVIVKCRAHQRFIISKDNNANFAEFLEPLQRKVYANIRILPEIVLPDPLYSLNMGSLARYRDISTLDFKLRQFQSATTVWPQFVFNPYRLDAIIERVKKYITSYKIESIPTDLTFMSFWLCRNLIFDFTERTKIFITNSVNLRMQIIEKSLNQNFFCCKRCKSQIADCSALFAMSKHGVQANYCNPAGFIHEINTVRMIRTDAIHYSDLPSTSFSWFPGYSWQIILCRMCDIHIGWKFSAVKSNLIPKQFFALSSVNVVVDLPTDSENENYLQVVDASVNEIIEED